MNITQQQREQVWSATFGAVLAETGSPIAAAQTANSAVAAFAAATRPPEVVLPARPSPAGMQVVAAARAPRKPARKKNR